MSTESRPEPSNTDVQVNAESSEIFNLIGNEKRISKEKHYMGIAYLLQSYKGGTYYFQIDSKSSSNKRGSCIINEDRRLVSVGWNTILLENSATEKKFHMLF